MRRTEDTRLEKKMKGDIAVKGVIGEMEVRTTKDTKDTRGEKRKKEDIEMTETIGEMELREGVREAKGERDMRGETGMSGEIETETGMNGEIETGMIGMSGGIHMTIPERGVKG